MRDCEESLSVQLTLKCGAWSALCWGARVCWLPVGTASLFPHGRRARGDRAAGTLYICTFIFHTVICLCVSPPSIKSDLKRKKNHSNQAKFPTGTCLERVDERKKSG